jgi:hypothetical protein
MQNTVAFENIEEMRRRQGIEDVELRSEIRGLAVGDFVRLTLVNSAEEFKGESLLVRITSIRGYTFRGKLANEPAARCATELHLGSPVVFTTAHIHSVPKDSPEQEQ